MRATGLTGLAALALAGCAASGATVDVVSQASGSAYFNLSRPAAYGVEGGLGLAGRLCRRGRTTVLSPPAVRLEHVSPTGDIVEVARGRVAAIYRRSDQACATYHARVGWRLAPGDVIRACVDRGRACPAQPAAAAVIAAPALAPPGPKP